MTGVEAEHAFSRETAEGAAYSLGSADAVWTLEFELGYVDAVRRVTRERMRDAARRYLRPDRFTGAAIGGAQGGAE
jgi:predicted Zn-dependent peptidase